MMSTNYVKKKTMHTMPVNWKKRINWNEERNIEVCWCVIYFFLVFIFVCMLVYICVYVGIIVIAVVLYFTFNNFVFLKHDLVHSAAENLIKSCTRCLQT
jgi:hypothetical protein